MQNLKKAVTVTVLAGGLAAAGAGVATAHSTSGATAAGSPGVLSGNVVQAPVNVSVNACGNTIDIVGALNPAFGNTCVNR